MGAHHGRWCGRRHWLHRVVVHHRLGLRRHRSTRRREDRRSRSLDHRRARRRCDARCSCAPEWPWINRPRLTSPPACAAPSSMSAPKIRFARKRATRLPTAPSRQVCAHDVGSRSGNSQAAIAPKARPMPGRMWMTRSRCSPELTEVLRGVVRKMNDMALKGDPSIAASAALEHSHRTLAAQTRKPYEQHPAGGAAENGNHHRVARSQSSA